jgi:hypothetical protein
MTDAHDIVLSLAAIESRLAAIEGLMVPMGCLISRLADRDMKAKSLDRVFQVQYRDSEHNGGQPLKTVLIPRNLPSLELAMVPVLCRLLSKLEGCMSVRQRQGESMADDLIAILKRQEAE